MRGLSASPVSAAYPLLLDETCFFLAVDFDKTGWQTDAAAFLRGCRRLGLAAALERSRSGRGGHVWLFFEDAIPAALARRLGSHLLTEAMEDRPDIGLDSYDRLFPNQDTMPQGGFGDLIALPLQKGPRDQSNSVFVDDDFVPWPDQWSFLATVGKLARPDVERIVHIGLPRGCLEDIRHTLDGLGVRPIVRDERHAGRPIDGTFHGELRAEQQTAARAMLSHDTVSIATHDSLSTSRYNAARSSNAEPMSGVIVTMTDWLADTRFILRGIRRSPSFAITVVATLILGLGPVAAMFAFADGYLFRPLPFPDAERVYVVSAPGNGLRQTDTDVLRHSSVAQLGFAEWMVGRRVRGFGLLIDNRRVDFYLEGVSPTFRKTLAIPIVAGRDFTDDDHRPGDPVPIWLTHSFWLRQFGGDTSVIGRTFATDAGSQQHVVVVGILGPTVSSFDGANEPPAGISAELSATPDARRGSSPFVRLPAGMTPEQATDLIARALNAGAPSATGTPRTVQLRSLAERQVAGGRPTAEVLFVAAMLVLLLAAITILHLLLARGVARASEVATRAALGASAWRVARIFLTEGLLLGAAGVAGSLLFGAWLARVIQSRIPLFPTSGRSLTLVPMLFDLRVLIFTIVLGLLISCAASLWPLRRALARSFAVGNRSSAGVQAAISTRLSRGILASELAVATILIAGSVFIGSGIWRYLQQPLGFDYHDRYWMTVSKSDAKPLTSAERETALGAWRAIPGLWAASWDGRPTAGNLEVPSRAVDMKNVGALRVASGYFEAWNLHLRQGRWFSPEELTGHEPVAVVDQKFASVAWPGEVAVGQPLLVGGASFRVVGVIEPKKRSLRRMPPGQVYVPMTGAEDFSTAVLWAPHAHAADLTRMAEAVSHAVPGATVQTRPVTLQWLFLRETGEAEFQAPIIMMFGAITLLLAAAGVFGLVSYLVERRLREFGIRVALGATPIDLWKHVTWQGVLPSLIGIAIGLAGAAALEKVVRASVFGWDASAPLAISAAAVVLLLIAMLAAVLPTMRAMRVDPASTLRME